MVPRFPQRKDGGHFPLAEEIKSSTRVERKKRA